MPFGNMGGPTLIVILFIVLLLFGAPKLPALAKSIGQSMKILKKEIKSDDSKSTEAGAAAATDTTASRDADSGPGSASPAAEAPGNEKKPE